MTPTPIETIEAMLLQLPKTERLLASLDEDDEIQMAWIAEAERRANALDRGEIGAIPLEAAMRRVRASLP